MQSSNWSEVLRSDLDKLSQLSQAPKKAETVTLKEGERRNVTILFLDIQGFTAMSEKLDPEDVQLIIDNCFKILSNEIEKHFGFIEKYEGDRLMALFGSRHASEQDNERAVRAALGMREKFREVNQILAERKIEIGMRIGVNSGLVVTGRIGKGRDQDFTVMGDAVNLASRLEAAAPVGEILISDEVRRTVGDVFLYQSLGEIEVKGKREPISVCCVKGINSEQAERWERSPFTKRIQYVPRIREDALLENALDLAGSREFGAVALSGPAGVGKSRLIYEFLRKLREQRKGDLNVIRATSPAHHRAPFSTFADLFGRLLSGPAFREIMSARPGQAESDRAINVIEYVAGEAEPDAKLQSLEPEALRVEIHLAIRSALERLVARAQEQGTAPLVIYMDDLQWADHASLEVLEFLGGNLERTLPILFIWAFRPEFRPGEKLREQFRVEEVSLNPLSRQESSTILRHVLGETDIGQADMELLVNRSGGNPFFLEELIQSLIDDQILVKREEKWVLTQPVDGGTLPDTLQRIIVSRIDKLDRQAKETLMAASVVGDPVPDRVLLEIGKMMNRAAAVKGQIQHLEDLGFLYGKSEGGLLGSQISFRHALVRDVVYSMILNHNKKILHELTGKALEIAHGDRAEEHAALLFHHFQKSSVTTKAVDYGFMALEKSVRQYAVAEGLETISLLRPWVTTVGDRSRLLEAEIRLHDFQGKRNEQLAAIEALKGLADAMSIPNFQERVALHEANYHVAVGEFRQAKDLAGGGLPCSPDEKGRDSRICMELLKAVGIACYSMGEYEEAYSFYSRGLAIAEKIKDRSVEGSLLNAMGLVHFNSSRPNEALRFYSRTFDIMSEIGDRRGLANALGNQGLVYWTLGSYSMALERSNRSHEIFREIGYRKGQAVTLGNIGVFHHKLGQYREALGCYEKAFALRKEIHDRAGEGYDLVNIGQAYTHLGDFSKALEHFEQGRAVAEEVGSGYLLAENLNCSAIVYRKLGEMDPQLLGRAREHAERALEVSRSHKLIPGQIKAMSNLARTIWLLGEREKGLQYSHEAVKLVESHEAGVEGSEEDAYVNHYHLLEETGQQEEALRYLSTLVTLIKTRAEKIKEEKFRKSFLEEVRQNRYALREWEKHQKP